MSIRLSIVLSQSTGGTAIQQDMEGDLVARLIGLPGLDLCLVGPLERSTQETTDRLVLEGLQGDFALLTWHAAEAAIELLRQAGQVGERVPHALDPFAPNDSVSKGEEQSGGKEAAGRRFYLVELRGKTSEQVVDGLQQILAARRTKTVAIGISAPALPIAKSPPQAAVSVSGKVPASSSGAPELPHKPQVLPASTQPIDMTNLLPAASNSRSDSGTIRDEWDDLVDDLNDSDI